MVPIIVDRRPPLQPILLWTATRSPIVAGVAIGDRTDRQ